MCFSSIIEAISYHSSVSPEKIAVIDISNKYTYKKFYEEICHIASFLKRIGFQKDDRVLVECTQDINFLIIDFACELLGVVFIPFEKKLNMEQAASVHFKTKSKYIIASSNYKGIKNFIDIQSVFIQSCNINKIFCTFPNSHDTAEILFSTGTTGQPKGIVISHRANVAIAQNISSGVNMKPNTVELIPMPLSHSHGLCTCYAHFYNGSTVVIFDGVSNVGGFFRILESANVNALDISPTLAKLLVKIARRGLEKYSRNLDYIELGTAALDSELRVLLKEIFPKTQIYNFYGSTEAGRSCVLNISKEDFPCCIGYPSKNSTFFITDENRNIINSSKENTGLIAVKGAMMMDGYFDASELTAEVLSNGILYSSDLGYIDEKGRIYVLGRADYVINYKGIKIAPEEIEVVAMKFPGIKDCACAPIADSLCGQVPKLFIQIEKIESNIFDLERFKGFLKENLDLALNFFATLFAILLAYYVFPKKHRWIVLLCANILFVYAISRKKSLAVMAAMFFSVWGLWRGFLKNSRKRKKRKN